MRSRTWIVVVTAVLVAAGACAQTTTGGSQDASYPKRAVKVIVPFAPGSSTDIAARVWADCYERTIGKPFTVENRDGGSGSIGMTQGAQAEPDGYTIVFGSTSSGVLTPELTDATYDVDSFVPVGSTTLTPAFIVVAKDSPISSMDDLIAAGRAKTLTVTDSGVATISGLLSEALVKNYDIDVKHVTPSSVAEIKRGLEQGDYDYGVTSVGPETLPWITEHQLKGIAVATAEPVAWAPDLPTLESTGYGEGQLPGNGIMGYWAVPAGTSPQIVESLERTNRTCRQDKTVIRTLGQDIVPPAELDAAAVQTALKETAAVLETSGLA